MENVTQERVIIKDVAYKPAGVLRITNQRIIGKQSPKWRNYGFNGEIRFEEIVSIGWLKRTPIISVPGIEIKYTTPKGNIDRVIINFPSFASRVGIKIATGYDPKRIYNILLEVLEESQNGKK